LKPRAPKKQRAALPKQIFSQKYILQGIECAGIAFAFQVVNPNNPARRKSLRFVEKPRSPGLTLNILMPILRGW